MRIITSFFIVFCFLWPFAVLANLPSVAFYYGSKLAINQAHAFDIVVVSPDSNSDPKTFNNTNSQLFAYVSVGEVANSASYRAKILPQWLMGGNEIWQSKVIDQTKDGWQTFFLEQIITPLWNKGYRGFFFDTLDSYNLAVHDTQAKSKQIQGLIDLIKKVKQKYPLAKLILNRGFELMPSIHDLVYADAAESLFAGWDQRKKIYREVPETDRLILLSELKKVQQFNIPVIVIDYLPPSEHQQSLNIAKKIAALNMIPWIADGQLAQLGVGQVNPVPRKILLIYTKSVASTIFNPAVFVLLGMPIDYLGYLAEYHDANKPLPEDISSSDYAGIVVWANPTTDKQQQYLHDWLVKRLTQHIPIMFMDSFGFRPTKQALAPFGIDIPDVQPAAPKSVHISYQDKNMVGFEIKPFPNRHEFFVIHAGKNSHVLLQLKDENNQMEDAIAVTAWGGYVISPYDNTEMPDQQAFWILNPFLWLQQSLRLDNIPVPDITTENGRRLMFAHIDGDGFPSKAEWSGGTYAGTEIENHILKKYKIPTTVSVITGDIAPNGLYPTLSKDLVAIARDIYKLPWVEIATHTFSHPFDWILVEEFPQSGLHNLPIPHYVFNAEREIAGSANYINQMLAPQGKRCKILLWSGSANPNETELGLVFKAHLANLNGGNTSIVNTFRSLTNVSPAGRQQGEYFQVYSPITNEESYTNAWNDPFYGFDRVIETFKLTDTPRRLKPIDIYYHFYSGSKLAALNALKRVYNWTLMQPVLNIYASEFVEKILDANTASIAHYHDGWQIRTSGSLREIRIPIALGLPDLERSENIIGYNKYNDSYYLHLGTKTQSILYLTKNTTRMPYLVDANGFVIAFKRDKNRMTLRLKSYLPLQWTLANMSGCTLKRNNEVLTGNLIANQLMVYHLTDKDSDDLQVNCE